MRLARAVQLAGRVGDIQVFDADLVHAGSRNASGARRRSLLMTCFAAPLYASHVDSAPLRSIRMDAAWFDPPQDLPGWKGAPELGTPRCEISEPDPVLMPHRGISEPDPVLAGGCGGAEYGVQVQALVP